MVEESKNYLNEIADYIKKNLRKGYTKESLKWALVNQGYSKIEVEKALRKVDLDMGQEAPVLRTQPVIKYEAVPIEEVEDEKPFWKRWLGL